MNDDLNKRLEDLQGAKFRILNELLYTRNSDDASSHFRENK